MQKHLICEVLFEEVRVIFKLFTGEVAKVKKIRNLTNADLAKMTGYKESTIEAFMKGARPSEYVARAISHALGIEM